MEELEEEWAALVKRHLPVAAEESPWRFSRPGRDDDPSQGFKIHVSATILDAGRVLARIAPYLRARGILFKAPASLVEIKRINCGLFYGVSQIGKVFTVYPPSARAARAVARRLAALTEGFEAPAVPFDLRYSPGRPVFYRYGSFSQLRMTLEDGREVGAIRRPDGSLVPDEREAGRAVPEWIADTLAPRRPRGAGPRRRGRIGRTIFAFEALSKRGKGGVYRCLDLSGGEPRVAVLKEGSRLGEIDWSGVDGRERVLREAQILPALQGAGVRVPGVYDCFTEAGNAYLLLEAVTGPNVQSLLEREREAIGLDRRLDWCRQLARIVDRIHGAGWVWRDCKPLNLIAAPEGEIRPLDFEGACHAGAVDALPWGTAGYVPPEWGREASFDAYLAMDRFALGASMHHLLSGVRPHPDEAHEPLDRLLPDLPPAVPVLVSALLDPDPAKRPPAARAVEALGG
jgi:hypothetical protein